MAGTAPGPHAHAGIESHSRVEYGGIATLLGHARGVASFLFRVGLANAPVTRAMSMRTLRSTPTALQTD